VARDGEEIQRLERLERARGVGASDRDDADDPMNASLTYQNVRREARRGNRELDRQRLHHFAASPDGQLG